MTAPVVERHPPVIERRPLAWRHVVGAMLVLGLVLALLAPHYGYHRDELYFRMLPLAWGYTDQPPLTPLLARGAIAVLGDSVVALRVVALVCALASLPLLVAVTREVGGSALAQAITAWGMAGAAMTLSFGHVLLTGSLDLVVWPAALLLVIRAVLRDQGRWWIAAGAVIGLSSANKLLVVVLMAGIAVGLALLGPRRWLRSGALWTGVAVAGVLALPAVIYQATHGWPQLEMGAALGASNGAEVRVMVWPMLVLMVGPVLAVLWMLALVEMFRREEWRRLRFLAPTFVVVVAFVLVGGTQAYYTIGVLGTLVALGSVPLARWARTRGRRAVVTGGLAVNAIGCVVTSLPVLPVESFGASGLASVNPSTTDQVGWPTYAEQIRSAAASAGAEAIVTSNYGEAGALDRFGSGGLPVVSGHNALWDLGGPPAGTGSVLLVGLESRAEEFASCEEVGELANGVGVDTEEEGVVLLACEGPVAPWAELWTPFRHLD